MEIEEMEKLLTVALEQIKESKKNQSKPKKKTTKKKTVKKVTKKEEPKIPYSDTETILKNMKVDESISRFGILWNSEQPYKISGTSIIKFYNDYNIDKRFKLWHMSYNNKDIIINNQLTDKPKKMFKQSVENRIKQLEDKLKNKPKNKTVNQSDKMENFIINQIEKLEEML